MTDISALEIRPPSPTRLSRCPAETVMRLGEFLLKRRKVSSEALEAAVRMQEHNSHLIGVLAVDRGMMTSAQLEEVLREQATSRPHTRLGVIAMSRGYLTSEQVETLREIQEVNRMRIGEILVLQSSLTETELLDELKAFRAHVEDDEQRKTA